MKTTTHKSDALRGKQLVRVTLTASLVVIALVTGVSHVAGASPEADCAGSGGGIPYVTDSGLTVTENHTEGTISRFFFPDSETVRFEYVSDAVNLSAPGTATARLENGTGPTTCLGDVDASSNDVTVSPDSENNLTLSGTYASISFRDTVFTSGDTTTDIAYDASDPAVVSVHNTGFPDGQTVVARDGSTGTELERTRTSGGTATFTELPTGTNEVDLASASPSLGVEIEPVANIRDGATTPVNVTVNETNGVETIDLTVTLRVERDANGTVVYDQSIEPAELKSDSSTVTFGSDDGTAEVGPLFATGDYSVTATVDASIASAETAQSSFKTDGVRPTAVAGPNRVVTVGETVSFDGTESTDNIRVAKHRWDMDDNTIRFGPTPNHTFTEPGTYEVQLRATDGVGNSDIDMIIVTVEESAGPGKLPGAVGPPNDLDGDGLFEDINGDGEASVGDSLAYYANRETESIRNNPGAFDFDGDGTAGTVFDVVVLFQEIAT